jgi:hypothetical protein
MKGLSSLHLPLKLSASLLMGSLLLACHSYPQVNRDPAKNNKASFQRDALDCARAYPESSSGAHVKQRIGCMNLKGWY